MNLVAINNEHTLDLDRLKGGWVLDVGCRFFDFAADILRHRCKVLAIDPSRDVTDPGMPGVIFEQCALVHDNRTQAEFCDWSDGTPSHLVYGQREATASARRYSVPCLSVINLMFKYNIGNFDAIKLDCEGAEFDILENLPGPVATQITVAFHDFINPTWSDAAHARVLSNLSRWYDVIQDESTARHGHATPCHWDSLFILRGA